MFDIVLNFILKKYTRLYVQNVFNHSFFVLIKTGRMLSKNLHTEIEKYAIDVIKKKNIKRIFAKRISILNGKIDWFYWRY